MNSPELRLVQNRVEVLIAKLEILGQDVTALRRRVEEVKAHQDLELEKFQAHADQRHAELLAAIRELKS